MAWTNSKVFRAWLADSVARTEPFDLDADTLKSALYGTTPTPDQNVTSALSAYNAGTSQWVTANEITHAQWPAGGIALTGVVVNSATAATVFLDATDTPSSGSTATLAGVFGTLVYDSTVTTPVANQGISYNYFGGTQSVTNGTFTVVWNANGIWRATL